MVGIAEGQSNYIVQASQQPIYRFLDIRVEVHRIQDLHIWITRCDLTKGLTNPLKSTTKTFSTMPCNQE